MSRSPAPCGVVGGVVGWVVVGVLAVVLLPSLAPAALGLSMRAPWAQLVQLRSVTATGALVLAALLGAVALVRRRRRLRREPGRPQDRRTGAPRRLPVLVLVLGVVAAGHGGVLVARGALAAAAPLSAGPGDLVVVSLNVEVRGAVAGDVVELAVRRGADVLALTEVDPERARAVADGLAAAGRPVEVLCAPPGPVPAREDVGRFSLLPYVRSAACLLVAAELGPYAPVEGPALRGGAVVARPADGGSGPPLAVVHTLPPIPGAFDMGLWRAETAASVALCRSLEGGVAAGDLNATQDHAVLRSVAPCADAAALAGAAAQGTWPSSLPPALASTIDHVLVDPDRWSVRGTAVEEVAGTDHRALVAVLRER